MEPWQKAVEHFEKELTDEERVLFTNAQPEDILKDVSKLEAAQRKSSKTRQILVRIKPLLDTFDNYGKAMDVFANVSSVLPPLWGSLRVLLAAAQNYNDYFSKLIDTLERIGDLLPRYSTFTKLLQFHAPLQQALQETQIQMITFFIRAKSVLLKSPFRLLIRTMGKSFDSDFEDCIGVMRRYKELVEAESHTASIILQVQENQRAEEERQRAESSRRRVERLESISDERCKDDAIIWLNARKCQEERTGLEKNRTDGTCDWILEREQVSEWIARSDVQVLWIHGAPGCGKSFLYSKLLNHLETYKPVLYFLFCGGDKERVTISALLRSWCLQILELFPQLSPHLDTARNTHKNSIATDGDITELFKLLIDRAPTTVYLSVDALNECEDGDQFFKRMAFVPRRFKILVTSRTPANIRKDLVKIQVPLRALEIQPELTKTDIHNFINARLVEADLSYSESTISKVRKRLTACDGMFLWVKLMIEHLQSQTCEYDVLQSLQDLPEGLPQTYERILQRIDRLSTSRRLLAYKIFLWGLTVRCPVSVSEMRLLLAIQPRSDTFYETRLISVSDCDSTILTVSGGLLQLRGPEKKIYFTHFTVTEFLHEHVLQGDVFQDILACYDAQGLKTNESLAAAVCLRYLCYDFVSALGIPRNCEDVTRILLRQDDRCSLVQYAVSQWFKHLSSPSSVHPDDSLVTQLALRFLDDDRPNLDVCWHFYWFSAPDASVSLICPSGFSGLHIAAYYGLASLIQLLLPRNTSSVQDSAGRSPLWWAASKGYPKATRVLIESAGFDPDEADNYSIAPVHRVAANGHEEVLEVMLSLTKASDNRVLDSEGWTPLHWAASRGQISILKRIMECRDLGGKYGSKPDKCHSGRTALHLAALNGHDNIVQELTKYDHSVLNNQDMQGCTPLHLAAIQGHQRVVEKLLKEKADSSILDNSGKTAAEKAKIMGNDHITLLLETTVQFQAQRKISQNHSKGGTLKRTVANFVRHEMDVKSFYWGQNKPQVLNSLDIQDISTLQTTINSHKSSLDLFMDKGRSWRRSDNRGRTMLHHSAALGYDRIVRKIMDVLKSGKTYSRTISPTDREEFLNKKDDRGWTALHYSAAGQFPAICRLLLSNGLSPHITNEESLTAYDIAVQEGHPATLEAIARHGYMPSVQIASVFGLDALHISARDDTLTEQDIATLDTEHVQITDRFGRTPLYRATEMGSTRAVELLLSRINLSVQEILEHTLLTEERNGNDDLARFYLCQLESGCLLLVDQNLQLLAQQALTRMIKRNNTEAVRALCDAGVRLSDCRDYSGELLEGHDALVIAIVEGSSDVANLLIRRGADIFAVDRHGASMLYLAADRSLFSIVECLLMHGADHAQSSTGTTYETPFEKAVAHFNNDHGNMDTVRTVRVLLKYGASFLSLHRNGQYIAWKAIHLRTSGRIHWPEIKKLLEEHGYAMLAHEPDEKGYVPIHHAVASNDVHSLRDHLESGVPVDWSSFDSPWQSPLAIAVQHESLEAAELLLDYGADITSIADPSCHHRGFKAIAEEHPDFIERLVQSC